MTLPNDISRCHGVTAYAVCEKRETCRRALDVPTSKYAWFLEPIIPGPCGFYMQAPVSEANGSPSPTFPQTLPPGERP